MGMSDKIESFILELLKNDDDEWLEIGRNELASIFDCVPSQINYVISTRFNPDRGYIVESKRGGGGCLRIKKVDSDNNDLIYNMVMRIGKEIDLKTAESILIYLYNEGKLDEKSHRLIKSAVSDKSIPPGINEKDEIRASILKNMLIELI